MSDFPWPAGAATGIGSLPGTDPVAASRHVFGELPDLPHLPELPQRGAGADMIGRAATLLVDLPCEIVPSGWRLTARPGRDLRRARDFLAWDLDALEAVAADYDGTLKVQVCGPWTLAASVELPSGHKVVSDPGAVRDLADSLVEGVAAHVAEVRRRVPHGSVVLQLDEPRLPAVLGGRVATPSGYGTVAAVEAAVAQQRLASVLGVVGQGSRVVHCCAAGAPIELLRESGADALALDAELVEPGMHDALGEAIDNGASLWLGVVPSTDAAVTLRDSRAALRRLWKQLGFADSLLAQRVVPTPACGLAGASSEHVRRVLAVLRDLGRDLVDPVENDRDVGPGR
jgi:methionine synthase II (cobalamin-independent)